MLYENRLPYKFIYLLLFLFSLNIFNQSSLILAAVVMLVVLVDRGHLYIISKDNTFFALVLFSVTFFVFSAQSGLGGGNIGNRLSDGILSWLAITTRERRKYGTIRRTLE